MKQFVDERSRGGPDRRRCGWRLDCIGLAERLHSGRMHDICSDAKHATHSLSGRLKEPEAPGGPNHGRLVIQLTLIPGIRRTLIATNGLTC
jgi:hypothetical protein